MSDEQIKIYKLDVERVLEHAIDPVRGTISKYVDQLKPSTTHTVKMGDDEFAADEGGTFTLPLHIGQHFLRMPGWYEGENPLPKPQQSASAPSSEQPKQAQNEMTPEPPSDKGKAASENDKTKSDAAKAAAGDTK